VYYLGSIENGSGAQRNASTITSMKILFLLVDKGDISSSGLASELLILNIKTNNAII
jgi:hypothetical protein